MPFGEQLFVDLGPEAVHQNQLDPHALNESQVLCQGLKFVRLDRLSRNGHHKGLAPVHVNVGGHRSEPGHKGEVKNQRHKGVVLKKKNVARQSLGRA